MGSSTCLPRDSVTDCLHPSPSADSSTADPATPASTHPARSHFSSDTEDETLVSEGHASDENENESNPPPTEYQRVKFKKLEKLNAAVRTHGVNAPFTLSLLEHLREGGYLTPNKWTNIARTTLPRTIPDLEG